MLLKHMQKFSLKSEKLLWRLLLALMVFIPLYPKFPLINIPRTYVAVRIEDIFLAFVVFVWIINRRDTLKKILNLPIIQLFLLFWAIGAASLFSAYFITHSISWHLGFLHYLRRVEYMILFIVAATTIKSFDQVVTILKAGLAATLIIVLYGFGQVFLRFPVISTTNREFSKGLILFLSPEARVNSTFAGHYDLAIYLSIVLAFLSGLFFYFKDFIKKGIIASSAFLSFILLGMTAARISFVATLIALSLSFWMNNKRIFIILMILLAIGSVGVIPDLRHRLVATITVNFLKGGGPKYTPPEGKPPNLNKLSESSKSALFREVVEVTSQSGAQVVKVPSDVAPGEPINATELGVYRSYGIRLDAEWPRALRAFYKNPFLGTGYSSLTIATDSDLLRSLGEVGLLGTICLILILMIISRQILRSIKNSEGLRKGFLIGSCSSMVAFLVSGLFLDVLEASKVATVFWFIMGVAWAVSRNYEEANIK